MGKKRIFSTLIKNYILFTTILILIVIITMVMAGSTLTWLMSDESMPNITPESIVRPDYDIECGCGGTPQLLSKTLLLRNALLMVFALLPLLGLPEALQSAEIVVAIAAAVFMWLAFLLFEQVNANLLAIREMANSLKRI